jgi:hypothetical protein
MHVKDNKNLSVKVGLAIVLGAWLLYTIYWFVKSTNWWPLESSVDLILAIVGTVGLGFRIAAVSSAILAFGSYLKGKPSNVLSYVKFALLLETPYFLSFIPSAVFGFAVGSGIALGYHTLTEGGLWFIFETAIPTLVEAVIMPLSLLKLRFKLKSPVQSQSEITKWACITGISYLIVFWLTYLTQWIATFLQPVSYASVYPGYGLEYLSNYPINMFTFIFTAVGLPLLMLFFVWSSLPAIRDSHSKLDLRKTGITLTLLGIYFITIITVFSIFGAVGGASIWVVFFMFNNPDLWCISLPVLGIALILTNRRS